MIIDMADEANYPHDRPAPSREDLDTTGLLAKFSHLPGHTQITVCTTRMGEPALRFVMPLDHLRSLAGDLSTGENT